MFLQLCINIAQEHKRNTNVTLSDIKIKLRVFAEMLASHYGVIHFPVNRIMMPPTG